MTIEFENNTVFFEAKNLSFDFKIRNVLVVDSERVIVLLNIPNESKFLNNIFAFSIDGDFIWQVQPVLEAFSELKEALPFEGIAVLPNGHLSTADFLGRNFEIDIKTGKLLSHKVVR